MDIRYIELLATILTPIIILMLGMWAKGTATNHEKRTSLNNRIIEKRVTIYEAVGQDLNDIYIFLRQVGHWDEF